MPNIVIFNPATGTVKALLRSADEHAYLGRSDVLIDPVLPANPDTDEWKVDEGKIREWTRVEKDARDASAKALSDARQTAIAAAVADRTKDIADVVKSNEATQALLPELSAAFTDEKQKKCIEMLAQGQVDIAKALTNLAPYLAEVVRQNVERAV